MAHAGSVDELYAGDVGLARSEGVVLLSPSHGAHVVISGLYVGQYCGPSEREGSLQM